MVNWLHELAYFFGGVFFANALPHFISGTMGRPFQSPFARPRGEGLSSSTVNALWGFANFAAAYLLLHVGDFDLHSAAQMIAFGLGALVLAVLMARHFGRFNGGNLRG